MASNKLPEFPMEAIKVVDEYFNELIFHVPRLTLDDIPTDHYYALRNTGYGIIEILETLAARKKTLAAREK